MEDNLRTDEDLPVIPFTELRAPGVYLSPRGELVRLASDSLDARHRLLQLWGTLQGSVVTRLSANPFEPINECRRLAAAAGLTVRF